MIIVKLKGGVGNQLFQFAFARAVSEYRKEELYLDISDLLIEFAPRKFKLQQLKKYTILDQQTLRYFATLYDKREAIVISDSFPKNNIFRLLNDVAIKAIYLDGYFQNEFYFLQSAYLIKHELGELMKYYYNLSSLPEKGLMNNKNSVCIHLRRTDYLIPAHLELLGICEIDYYKRALDIVFAKIDNPCFYIFSDDYILADQIFSALLKEKINISSIINQTLFIEKDLVELAIMTKCKNFIIANSSFSWWGSYLAEDTHEKLVIAPKDWFRDKNYKQLSNDIGLKSWIRI